MLNRLNKICEGLEEADRREGVRKLMIKGYSKKNAVKYYNLWRKYYVTTLFNIT